RRGKASKGTAAGPRKRARKSGTPASSRGATPESEIEAGPENEDPEERRKRFLERNRMAALKCRQRKRALATSLEATYAQAQARNSELVRRAAELRDELLRLQRKAVLHGTFRATMDDLIISTDPEHPANLIPELCRQFYHLGWVTGTGGGMSIKDKKRDLIYVAPSGVQKERMKPEDLYVVTPTRDLVRSPPASRNLKPSQCTPLFFNSYILANAGACVHTHSQAAVMVTLLWGDVFRITHQVGVQMLVFESHLASVPYAFPNDSEICYSRRLPILKEMIKGIRRGSQGPSLRYYDTLVVPIIENTAEEEDLRDRMADAMKKYPESCAVLVRRHGVYVWGDTWEKAKAMTECYDYLFEIAVKMRQMGIDPEKVPEDSEYRHLTEAGT
ncbi:hypothetical protein HDU93_002947, partial [Gonapodya sp. JEL0774]